jgi:hypothetical protein
MSAEHKTVEGEAYTAKKGAPVTVTVVSEEVASMLREILRQVRSEPLSGPRPPQQAIEAAARYVEIRRFLDHENPPPPARS